MGYEELAVDEVDVSFDTAKAMVQSIQQWARVFVIIVSMSIGQRRGLCHGGRRKGVEAGHEDRE